MARAKREAGQPAEPRRLFAVVHAAHGQLVSPGPLAERDIVTAFLTAEHAQQALDGADVPAAELAGCRVVEFIEVRQPERDTPWGDGQFEHVQLAPGVRAGLRVTAEGRVRLCIPGGDLDVTDGGCELGLGLLEATKRAAQVREDRLRRARRRKTPPLCKRCGRSLFGFDPARLPLCPRGAGGELCEAAADGALAPKRARRRKLGVEASRVAHLPRRLPR